MRKLIVFLAAIGIALIGAGALADGDISGAKMWGVIIAVMIGAITIIVVSR